MRWPIPILAALLAASSPVACAAGARDQLEAFANGLDSLRGSFVQQIHQPDGTLGERAEGTLALKAPRQFRWEYTAPYEQRIVADGLNVWVHDLDLDQVTVKPQSLEEAQSPLTVITDLAQLDREYAVREAGEADGAAWLELTPKAKEPPFAKARLGLAGDALVRMELIDHLGQRNEIRFGRWSRNGAIDAALFTFTPPEGVDIVGEPAEGAQTAPIRD